MTEHDRERGRRNAAAWRNRNPGGSKAATYRWRKNHPERFRQLQTRNNSRRRQRITTGFCSAAQWLARVIYYGWRCAYCRKELTSETLTRDHRIPLSKGGTNWPSNLVPACRSCNSRKHNRMPT